MSIFHSKKLYEEVIKDPSRHFHSPEEVLLQSKLSSKQKDKILESWELDQRLLMTAEEENMTSSSTKPKSAQMIQEIQDARKRLH